LGKLKERAKSEPMKLEDFASKRMMLLEDIFKIIEYRCLYILQKVQEALIETGVDIASSENRDHWVPYLKTLIDLEWAVFLRNELPQYIKKFHKSDYLKHIEDAKTKNSSLFRIIGWDKAWLFADWVKWKVLDAQEKGDLKFLKAMGEAISKKPKARTMIKSKDKKATELVLHLFKAWCVYYKTYPERTKYNSIDEAILGMYEALSSPNGLTWFPEEFTDFDYFRKYLKRHKVIP
jgi:hypothetical protein